MLCVVYVSAFAIHEFVGLFVLVSLCIYASVGLCACLFACLWWIGGFVRLWACGFAALCANLYLRLRAYEHIPYVCVLSWRRLWLWLWYIGKQGKGS